MECVYSSAHALDHPRTRAKTGEMRAQMSGIGKNEHSDEGSWIVLLKAITRCLHLKVKLIVLQHSMSRANLEATFSSNNPE